MIREKFRLKDRRAVYKQIDDLGNVVAVFDLEKDTNLDVTIMEKKAMTDALHKADDAKKCGCKTPHVEEEQVKSWFVETLNSVSEDRDEIIGNVREVLEHLIDTAVLDGQIRELANERNVLVEIVNELMAENARVI